MRASTLVPRRSAEGPERAHAPDECSRAVGTTTRPSSVDSGPTRVVGLPPFPAVPVLREQIFATAASAFTTLPTRPNRSTARLSPLTLVTVMTCVKRFYVTIAYARSRAADGIAIACERADAHFRDGKGVNPFPSVLKYT